ncbi:MAG TPA: glycosyltransferase family 4 protein [Isosphaeraceae bacterium]|nr:glycosyltransferase family 4 protein [Isosphaeraceae bacterium]
MRILTLTNLYPTPFHPTRATFNRQKIRLLARRHPLAVIAPILWPEELAARWRGAAPLPRDRRVTCDGITVDHPRYIYPPKVLRGWYGYCFRESVRRTFQRVLAEFRPDVVFAPWAYPDGWAAVQLGHRAGLPVVIQVHGSDILALSRCPRRSPGTVEALRQADGIVAVSHDLEERVVALGADPSRVRVVYDGIDSELFHPGSRDAARARMARELPLHGPVVLFIGNLLPVKGLEVLIDAFARLAGQGVDFHGLLIGRGPLRSRLEARVRRLGLDGRVKLLGSRPHDQLPDWYRAADLFVLPSYSEGVPIVLLEAAACGTPFVASRVGGIPEIAHLGTSRLVPAGDAEALAEAIRAGLADGRRERLPHSPVRSHAEAVAELIDFFSSFVICHSSLVINH